MASIAYQQASMLFFMIYNNGSNKMDPTLGVSDLLSTGRNSYGTKTTIAHLRAVRLACGGLTPIKPMSIRAIHLDFDSPYSNAHDRLLDLTNRLISSIGAVARPPSVLSSQHSALAQLYRACNYVILR